MKYPKEQFAILLQALKQLAGEIDLTNLNPLTIHYTIAQQFNEGQKHNWLYVTYSGVRRGHNLPDLAGVKKLIDINYDFKLYPEGCNDNHISTAMNLALKQYQL